ncbi:MAG: dTMP kinase [Chloroflexi bacterium]|nr:dTMP kinase [Chloroflexota bacterium]
MAWFVALEGIDGAGTTTQSHRLVAWLQALGRPARYTKEPSEGHWGTLLRRVLTGALRRARTDGSEEPFDEATLALAFATDRVDHLASEVEPALAAGVSVVCDRYVLSSLAYQGRALDLAWLLAINGRCRAPDLTLYLDVPAQVGLARIAAARRARERYEQEATLAEVLTGYARGVAALREIGQRIVTLDGTLPIEAVEQAIQAEVQRLMGRTRT